MISLRWYQDKLLDRMKYLKCFGKPFPRFTFLDNSIVKGLGTIIRFRRRSLESPLCAKFENGTVRSFYPICHGSQEIYSLSPISFTRWLELMIYGWNNFQIGLLEIMRNGTGFITSIGLQCENDRTPYWFSNIRR